MISKNVLSLLHFISDIFSLNHFIVRQSAFLYLELPSISDWNPFLES
jgi:hypothetical protein